MRLRGGGYCSWKESLVYWSVQTLVWATWWWGISYVKFGMGHRAYILYSKSHVPVPGGCGSMRKERNKRKQTSRTNTSPLYFDDPSAPRFPPLTFPVRSFRILLRKRSTSCRNRPAILYNPTRHHLSTSHSSHLTEPTGPRRIPEISKSTRIAQVAPSSTSVSPSPSPPEAAWNSPKSPKVSNVESSSSRENDVEKVKGSASLVAAESENGPNPSSCMR
jgi:hypothetical protein